MYFVKIIINFYPENVPYAHNAIVINIYSKLLLICVLPNDNVKLKNNIVIKPTIVAIFNNFSLPYLSA